MNTNTTYEGMYDPDNLISAYQSYFGQYLFLHQAIGLSDAPEQMHTPAFTPTIAPLESDDSLLVNVLIKNT